MHTFKLYSAFQGKTVEKLFFSFYELEEIPLCLLVNAEAELVGLYLLKKSEGKRLNTEAAEHFSSAILIEDGSATLAAFNAIAEGKPACCALYGTPFQLSVWQALIKIPEGETATYSQIAGAVGSPKAARAVGTAIGANKLSILVPCHRVLPAAGGVGCYLWGSHLKQQLLNRESAKLSQL